jgi:hypothetical protein
MRPALVRLIPLVALVLAGACSHHPTFGRPMPQDTVPTTKERPEPKEKPKDPRRPPDGYQGLERGASDEVIRSPSARLTRKCSRQARSGAAPSISTAPMAR